MDFDPIFLIVLKHAVPRASPLGLARATQGTIFSILATRPLTYLLKFLHS